MGVLASLESNEGVNESGNRRRVQALVAYSAEAHSNGYALDKSLFGYKREIESILFLSAGTLDSRIFKWDKGNQTIRIYVSNTGAEVVAPLTENVRVEAKGS